MKNEETLVSPEQHCREMLLIATHDPNNMPGWNQRIGRLTTATVENVWTREEQALKLASIKWATLDPENLAFYVVHQLTKHFHE